MSVLAGMAMALAMAGSQAADDSGWPTMHAGERDEQFICAIDPASWTRTWRGRHQAVEVCVFGEATIGGVPFTHSTATIEWRCGLNGRTAHRTSVSYHRAGEPEAVATQSEGYGVSEGLATPCLSWNDSAARTDRMDAATFVGGRLRAWGAAPQPRTPEPAGPRWAEWLSAENSGAACALAVEDLLRRDRVAIGRFACVYDPKVYTPHRLGAGPGGQPQHFRHERGFVAARCDQRRITWSQGDLYESADDRTPYRIGTNEDGLYLGPYARYRQVQDEAMVDLLCAHRGGRPETAGSLDDFIRARLTAWAAGSGGRARGIR